MKTILAVDDDPWVLEILEEALHAKQYRVLRTSAGAEAVRLLREQPVDLLLLDLNLPGQNGFSILNDLPAATVPVLFVSGCSHSFGPNTAGFREAWQQHFAQGTTDILYKPFPLALLYEKVEALIGTSEPGNDEPPH